MKRLLTVIFILFALRAYAVGPFTPGKWDIDIKQGADWVETHELHSGSQTGTVVDLTGCTVAAQVRPAPNSTHVFANMSCFITHPTDGQITYKLSHATTMELYGKPAFWDAMITCSGQRYFIEEGSFNVSGSITRMP